MRSCSHCGALLSPPDEQLSRRMSSDGRVAMHGGLIMLGIGVALLLYGSPLLGSLLIGLGGAVALIGMNMG